MLSLSIAKLLFFSEKNIFFSDFVFVLGFFDSFRENRKLLEARWLPHRSWNLRRLSDVRLRARMRLRVQCARACVCVCMRVRPSAGADNFWIDV